MNLLKAITCLAVMVLAFAVVGCGGDDSEAATIEVTAEPDGSLTYTETEITVPAGDVIVEFDNPSAVPHDVAFDDPSGEMIDKTAVFTEDSEALTLEGLEPGEYRYWCTVPGHLEAGMEGTLTVE